MFKKSINLGTKKHVGVVKLSTNKRLTTFLASWGTGNYVDGRDYCLIFSVTSAILSKSPGCSESRRHLFYGVSTYPGMSAMRRRHNQASLPLRTLSLVYTSQCHGKITHSAYASKSLVVDTVLQIRKSPCQYHSVPGGNDCRLYQHVNHFAIYIAPQVCHVSFC